MVLCHFHTGELCFSRRSSPHISIYLRKQVAWRSGSPRRVYVNTVGRPNDLSCAGVKSDAGGRETLLSGRVVKAKRLEVLSARRISLFQYANLDAQLANTHRACVPLHVDPSDHRDVAGICAGDGRDRRIPFSTEGFQIANRRSAAHSVICSYGH